MAWPYTVKMIALSVMHPLSSFDKCGMQFRWFLSGVNMDDKVTVLISKWTNDTEFADTAAVCSAPPAVVVLRTDANNNCLNIPPCSLN